MTDDPDQNWHPDEAWVKKLLADLYEETTIDDLEFEVAFVKKFGWPSKPGLPRDMVEFAYWWGRRKGDPDSL